MKQGWPATTKARRIQLLSWFVDPNLMNSTWNDLIAESKFYVECNFKQINLGITKKHIPNVVKLSQTETGL